MKKVQYQLLLLMFVASVAAGQVLTNGLVAYYPLDGNATDVTGNGNNGVIYGGVAPGLDRNGNAGGALVFNGNGYITVNNSPSLSVGPAFTIAFWFKVSGPNGNDWTGLVTKSAPSKDYYSGPRAMVAQPGMRGPFVFTTMAPPPYNSQVTPIPLELSYWYHFTLAGAGDSVRCYLNGKLFHAWPQDNSWTFTNANPLTLGSQVGNFEGRNLNGALDEVRIYNRHLLPSEIWSLYSGETPATGSLKITINDAEQWEQPGQEARVVLYNGSVEISRAAASANSVVSFTNQSAGMGYSYRVYVKRPNPWGEAFWGEKRNLTVAADATTEDVFTRNAPYMPDLRVFLDMTNEYLPEGGKRLIPPGIRLRAELQIKNPSYSGALAVSAYGALYVDRDKNLPYDLSLSTVSQSYAIGTSKTVMFYFNAPMAAGDYYLSVAARASSAAYGTTLTDAVDWRGPAFTVASGVLPPWKYSNTGSSHTIIVPLNIHPIVNGLPLSNGDFLGVFFDSSGTLACAGYEFWTGKSDIAVSAFGDDPTTPQKDGFAVEEKFHWKVFRASDGRVYDAVVSYAPVGGIVTNTNTYAANGISQLASLSGASVTQSIALRAGWSLISSYIIPTHPLIDSVFMPVGNDLIIVKNGAQKTYIPSVPVNTIGSWVKTEGYQVKMSAARTLSITGQQVYPESTSISLPLGWSIMPYLRDSEIPVASALSPVVGAVTLVKDQDGRTYIPSVGVNTIGYLKPGQAYQIKMSAGSSLSFARSQGSAPVPAALSAPTVAKQTATAPPWFFSNTGVSHTVIVPASVSPLIDGTALTSGDCIGVFYDSSGTLACAGYEPWGGNTSIAVAAFGDDPTTQTKDGLTPGESMKWKIWRRADGRVISGQASFLSPGGMGGVVTDSDKYTPNGISALSSLSGSTTGVRERGIPAEFTLNQNYPNPFNPSTTLSYGLARTAHVRLSVMNSLGQEISVLVNENQAAGYYEARFDAAGLASGVYFYRIRAGEFVQTRRLVLVR